MKAKQVLKQIYGYDEFRPGQRAIIDDVMAGQDTVGIMPTGGGKSIGYQIPAVLKKGTTIVISPLISLMQDQVDALKQWGISAAYLNSTQRITETRQLMQLAENGHFDLLYVAPERLEAEEFAQLLTRIHIPFIAVDEAHCVSQWGHDFRRSYLRISSVIERLSPRPVVAAFTATATAAVRQDIVRQLGLRNPRVHLTGFDRPNLYFQVLKGIDRKAYVRQYVKEHADQSGIIYTATRKETEAVCEMLEQEGILVGKYHAGMSDTQRAQQQQAFLYDEVKVMVATNAFGMGIDKSNVRYVLHWNLPRNMEAYYQEAGRAGRDGEPGQCILFFQPQDIMTHTYLIEQSVSDPERRNFELAKLRNMADYCHTQHCLRNFILNYFDEAAQIHGQMGNSSPSPQEMDNASLLLERGSGDALLDETEAGCNHCGNCNHEGTLVDMTLEAQKILSCVRRMDERYGMRLVAQVLRGSANQRVRELRLNRLTTYGIMKEETERTILDWIQLLVADGYLALSSGQYPVVRLTPQAIRVLKGDVRVYRRTHVVQREEGEEEALFTKLRERRTQIAQQEGLPPYMVFSDSTLRELALKQPRQRHELLNIKGIGETKLEKYGDAFLEILLAYQS